MVDHMSSFVNDDRAKQIERGELYFASYNNIALANLALDEFLITTGASECELVFQLMTQSTTLVSFREGITGTGTSAQTTFNMLRSSVDSLTTTLHAGLSSGPTGGTTLAAFYALDGIMPDNAAVNSEGGVIMKANTKYYLGLTNDSGMEGYYSYYFYFREI